jgi:hypothetical protein
MLLALFIILNKVLKGFLINVIASAFKDSL